MNKRGKEMREEPGFDELAPETQVKELKKIIRLTYKAMFWIGIFLFIPTMTKYITGILWLQYPIDIGISLIVIYLWRIKRGIKKKEKKELDEEIEKITEEETKKEDKS